MTRDDTDAAVQADIDRMLNVRHNRKTLGYSYYPTDRTRQPTANVPKKRVRPSRAGQPNWRLKYKPKDAQ